MHINLFTKYLLLVISTIFLSLLANKGGSILLCKNFERNVLYFNKVYDRI